MGEDDRDAILKRRQRLIAIALAGLATSGCGDSHTPEPDTGDMTDTSSPMPCLSMAADSGADTTPEPCLGAPLDSGMPLPGEDAGADADAGAPMPCLDFPEDTGP